MNIRFAKSKDINDLYELFTKWGDEGLPDIEIFKTTFKEILEEKDNFIIVYEENNSFIGYAQFFKVIDLGFPKYYEVSELLVDPTQCKRGIGKKIMNKIEEIAHQNGIKDIKLSSQICRSIAHVFYENIGYKMTKISQFYEKSIK